MENVSQIVPVFPLLIKNVTPYQVPGLTNHREFICCTFKEVEKLLREWSHLHTAVHLINVCVCVV